MIETSVNVRNLLGLHARAANLLAREASQFSSMIELVDLSTGCKADGKSIMQLLILAAGKGSELILRIQGEDQVQAAKVLTALFNDGFGEPCG